MENTYRRRLSGNLSGPARAAASRAPVASSLNSPVIQNAFGLAGYVDGSTRVFSVRAWPPEEPS